MPFSKGDPNINRNGRPKKGETFTDIFESKYSKETLLDKLYKKAITDEDYASLKYLMDRLEGTPKQTIAGDNEAPLTQIVVERATKQDGE
jgi:bacterioferritin (cytochrome b1)